MGKDGKAAFKPHINQSQQPLTSNEKNFSASVVASSLVPLHGRQALNKTRESLPGIQQVTNSFRERGHPGKLQRQTFLSCTLQE